MEPRLVVELKDKEERELAHRFKVRCAQRKMSMKKRLLSLINADLKL